MPRNPESGPADSTKLGGKQGSARAGSCWQGCLWLFGGQGLGREKALPQYKEALLGSRCGPYVTGAGVGVGVEVQQVGVPLQAREDLTREVSTLPAPKLLPRGEGTQLRGWGPSSASPAPLLPRPDGGLPPHELRPHHPVSAEAPSPPPSLLGPCRKSILETVRVPRSREQS